MRKSLLFLSLVCGKLMASPAPHVVEFISLRCPACLQYHQKEYPNVKDQAAHWTWLLFPQDIPSMLLIPLLKTLPEQKQQELLKKLMDKAPTWTTDEDALHAIKTILRTENINPKRLKQMDTEDYKDQALEETMALYKQYPSIEHVPSFIVDGKKVEGNADLN